MPNAPLEYATILNELLNPYASRQRQPSGRYAIERYPSLLSLLDDASNSGGSPGVSASTASVPLSLDVVDLKEEYGIKDSEYYRSTILGKLATDTYTEGDLQQWVDLHEAISNLFYPPVKEFSSNALECSNCGSSPLKGVKEPDFLVWCPACHQTWTMEDYETEIVSQLTDPLP